MRSEVWYGVAGCLLIVIALLVLPEFVFALIPQQADMLINEIGLPLFLVGVAFLVYALYSWLRGYKKKNRRKY